MANSKPAVILKARWVLPMSPGSDLLNEHSLVMIGERIADVIENKAKEPTPEFLAGLAALRKSATY